MERKVIHIQGLNYLASDKDAPSGVCRVLKNLHPYGNPKSPSWRAVNGPTVFLSGEYFSPYIYHRANLQSVMICGNIGEDLNQQIVTFPINIDGTLAGTTPTVLKNLGSSHPNREFRYAQIGDTLIISVIDLNVPGELYAVFVDGSETVIFPFNMPQAPYLTPSVVTVTTGMNTGWYGYRWALVLLDGTIARPSPVRMFQVTTTQQGYKFDIANISSGGVDWRKVVRGLGLFVSSMGTSIEDVLKSKAFYNVHTYERIFDATPDDTFTLDMTDTQILARDLMPEDNLLVHTLSAGEVYSYNKALILGDIKYDFVKPSKSTFGSDDLKQPYPPVSNATATLTRIGDPQTYSWRLTLNWTNPVDEKFTGVSIDDIERTMLMYVEMDMLIGDNITIPYAPFAKADRGKASLWVLTNTRGGLGRTYKALSYDAMNGRWDHYEEGGSATWKDLETLTIDFLYGNDWDGAAPDLREFGEGNGPFRSYTYKMDHTIIITANYSDGKTNPQSIPAHLEYSSGVL